MVPFPTPTQNLFNYFLFEKPFNLSDIDLVESLVKPLPSLKGEVSLKSQNSNRSVTVKGITYTPEFVGLFNIFQSFISEANSKFYNFDISHSFDPIQYTEYHSTSKDEYTWHRDTNHITPRKLSIVIQLSDPSEYEGGDLQIKDYSVGENIITIKKQKGQIVVFPSYLLHRVTPVTRGTRKSLVWWAGATTFK